MKIIIVGAGEVGFYVANRLALENKDVVVIDKDPEAVRRVSENLDVQVVIGSGSSPIVLEDAGIKEAEILLAVTDSDEINLVACLVANILSPATKKLIRVRSADFDQYHKVFKEHPPHIDTVINPEIEVVKTIERLMSVPGAVDVWDFANGLVKFIGIRLEKNSKFADIRLADFSSVAGVRVPLIAAIIREDGMIIPRGDDRLLPGDLIYFISENNKLEENLAIFGRQIHPINRVLIVGGGRIGFRLATLLESKSIYVKVIESSPEQCRKLAERMNKAVILHGDGSDQSLLHEENIQDMDVVVTLTGDEETNILVSLLAKRMGVQNAITKIGKFSYLSLMPTIGIEQVVSPRLSAIDTILQHIRRGKVLSAISMKGEQAEVLEAVALPTSEIVGKPLNKIAFPKGSILIGIIKGDTIIIPSGASVIDPDDRIIILARRQAIQKIEKILTVKLEFF